MKPFFETILIVVGFTGLIILYYLFVFWKKKHTNKVKKRQLEYYNQQKQHKLYRIFLLKLFNKIQADEIYWIEIYAEGFEDNRIFIKRARGNPNLLISFKSGKIIEEVRSKIDSFNVVKLVITSEDVVVEYLYDDKVIDLLYLILYEIFCLRKEQKLKFKY